MSEDAALRCAQCARSIDGQAITVGGESYCCVGCVAGGPCICDEADEGPEPIRLEAGPFAGQAELLRFAVMLEASPGLRLVALTLGDPGWGRFAVVAASPADIIRSIEAMPGYVTTVETTGDALIARVARATPPALAGDEEALLPARTRFRVFRPNAERRPPTPSPYAPSPPAPPAAAPPAPAAQPAAPASEPARPPADEPPRTPSPPTASARPVPAHAPPARTEGTQTPGTQTPLARGLALAAPPGRAGGAASTTPDTTAAASKVEHLALVVSPFHSFSMLSEFQTVVQAIEGVLHTRVHRFSRGTLHLAIEYASPVPLAERLEGLRSFRWHVGPLSPPGSEPPPDAPPTILATPDGP